MDPLPVSTGWPSGLSLMLESTSRATDRSMFAEVRQKEPETGKTLALGWSPDLTSLQPCVLGQIVEPPKLQSLTSKMGRVKYSLGTLIGFAVRTTGSGKHRVCQWQTLRRWWAVIFIVLITVWVLLATRPPRQWHGSPG